MSTLDKESPGGANDAVAASDPRRWKALGVLAAIQFMLVMDVTIVLVALPEIDRDLTFTTEGDLAWVLNGYVLMAGGFLLLGGRLADMFGRRKIFMIGVICFGVASATCGAAMSSGMLVSSRFVQGLGEALCGPAALGMIPILFPDARERMKALSVWGGTAALGGVIGSVVSGALTEWIDWRWIFYINIPIALAALLLVPRVMPESRMEREGRSVDFAGAIGITGGLVAVVYGLIKAADHAWGSSTVLIPLLAGIGVLLLTALWETRVSDPMVPIRFFTNRTRVTSNVVTLALLASFHCYAFLLIIYMQKVLDYSPIKAGMAVVPLAFAMGAGMGAASALMPRIGVKAVLAIGFGGAAAGLFVASSLEADSSYVGGVLPGMLVFGIFSAMCYPALVNGALYQVTGKDSGLASGVQTAMQQIGGALGLATLVPIAIRYTTDHIGEGVLPTVAQSDGASRAFRVGAILVAAAAVLVIALMQKVDAAPRNVLAEAEAEPTEDAAAQPTTTGAAS
ncbi:MFS transporter [Streptomyces sp. NPDC058308]|uniref:MFS transporter n=1 Tax=Streptomyces sp. NPDC058308 TaxID=3346440 RepID=UPI0036DFEDFA